MFRLIERVYTSINLGLFYDRLRCYVETSFILSARILASVYGYFIGLSRGFIELSGFCVVLRPLFFHVLVPF